MSILDDFKAATERIFRQVGYGELRELYVTGPQAIEMYRWGILRPGDETIRLLLSPEGYPMSDEHNIPESSDTQSAVNDTLEWCARLVESSKDARDLHEIAARIRARKVEAT